MTSRPLSASLTVALVLGFAAASTAQDPTRAPRSQRKARTTSATQKAGSSETKDEKAVSTDTSDNKETPKDKEKLQPGTKTEQATFGGGCFWCLEAVFERVPGVKDVVSGYAGGNVPNPTYQDVCTGLTGHAEVVQITYDPALVSYDKLLHIFWLTHDPTTLNAQGPDYGTQYRSVIFYHNEEQKLAAQKSYKELVAAKTYRRKIVTKLVPLTVFFPADEYHQDYFRKHPEAGYCQAYIPPKLLKLDEILKHK
jgi:peptide-methionine (S)-S-oxide reductase